MTLDKKTAKKLQKYPLDNKIIYVRFPIVCSKD